jgi:hypothetical protein
MNFADTSPSPPLHRNPLLPAGRLSRWRRSIKIPCKLYDVRFRRRERRDCPLPHRALEENEKVALFGEPARCIDILSQLKERFGLARIVCYYEVSGCVTARGDHQIDAPVRRKSYAALCIGSYGELLLAQQVAESPSIIGPALKNIRRYLILLGIVTMLAWTFVPGLRDVCIQPLFEGIGQR